MYGNEHEWLVNSLSNCFIVNHLKDNQRQTWIAGQPTVCSDAEMVKWMRTCHQGPISGLFAAFSAMALDGFGGE